ncbi:hypothetical protein ACVWYD_003881 [Morganella morganii]
MAKVQARNVDDSLYLLIEQSAMKHERSVEGEIRIALREYYTPPANELPLLTMREHWQQQTGERLQWLLDRLLEDGFFGWPYKDHQAGTKEFVRAACHLGTTPGVLMDIKEGLCEMTFDLAEEITKQFSVSNNWLLTGEDSPFEVTRINSMDYSQFFIPGNKANYTFEFIRICEGRHTGNLLILQKNKDTGHISMGFVNSFYLKSGMGSDGHANLKKFFIFLKTKGAHLTKNTYDFTPPEPDFDWWSVIGQHHPIWFQNANYRSAANWLQTILTGNDPDNWFTGWKKDLETIRDTPYGGADIKNNEII